MTVYVSNKHVSSRQAYIYTLIYIGDQGIVYLFVGGSKESNLTGVVKPVYMIPIFPLTVKAVLSKGHIGDCGPTRDSQFG